MICSGSTIFLSYLICFPTNIFSLAIDYDAKIKEYFEKEKITDATDRERKIATDMVYQSERADNFKEQLGSVKNQKDILSIPLQKLKLRLTIESAVKDHYPGGKPSTMSYMDAFNEMLISEAIRFTEKPDLMVFRKMIEDSEISTQRFIEIIKELYSKLSDQSGHNLEGYDIVKLSDDEKKITEILACVVSPVDHDHIVAVKLILKPHPGTPKTETIPLEELRCIRIEAQSQAEEKTLCKIKAEIKDEDVNLIFPRSKPKKIEHKDLNAKSAKASQHVIMVHFDNEIEAKKALEFSNRFLKTVLITLKVTSCNGLSMTTTTTTG